MVDARKTQMSLHRGQKRGKKKPGTDISVPGGQTPVYFFLVVGVAAPGGAVGAVAAAASREASVFADEGQRPDEGGRHRGKDEDVSKTHKASLL